VQLAPFLTFIVAGGVGLYVALGARNPSPAILLASLLLPFLTFYAITSFLMDYTLAVFLVMAVAYSFTTAAMMVPPRSRNCSKISLIPSLMSCCISSTKKYTRFLSCG